MRAKKTVPWILIAALSALLCFSLETYADNRCADLFSTRLNLDGAEAFEDAGLEQQIVEFLHSERALVSRFGAASRVRVHRDASGRILKRPVVLMFHGLFNSPGYLHHLEDRAYDEGSHVLNIRLPGHFEEANDRALDFVTQEEWVRRGRFAMLIASRLRSKVTIVGHSLGGALAAHLAEEFPFYTRQLVLFAPAFKVAPGLAHEVDALTSFGLSGWVLGAKANQDRYLSTWSGIQVEKLGQSTVKDPRLSNLAKIPILWVDVEGDTTVSATTNAALAKQISLKNPGLQYVQISKSTGIVHNQLARFRHDYQVELLERVLDFLEP